MVNVLVDGDLLKQFREKARLSAEEVCSLASAERLSLSPRTLSRIENEGSASKTVLRFLARLYREDAESFYPGELGEGYRDGRKFAGLWHGRFVEKDRASAAAIVIEELELFFDGNGLLVGRSHVKNTDYPRVDDVQRAVAAGDTLKGDLIIEGNANQPCFFICTLERKGDWMEGVTGWVDPDIGGVQWSRYILIRDQSPFRDLFLRQAVSLIETEIAVFEERVARPGR